MKLHFLGGVGTVTGAKYLLEVKTKSQKMVKIFVDFGMVQGTREAEEENYKDFPFNASEIDYLFITHAHIDHIGLIPKLCKEGFKGKIFATSPTIDLVQLTLDDSQKILEREARDIGRPPLYTKQDIKKSLALMNPVQYQAKHKLIDEIYFRFQEAGHILGSAIIEIWAEGKKIVFSGNLGNAPLPLLNPPAKIIEADYVLIESTYGNRIHEDRTERKEALENIIEDTFSKKGVLMIPSFAVERTQELLYELNELIENHRIPRVPIFIDSPLAIKATEVYKKYRDYFNKEATDLIKTGDDLFRFPGLTLTEDARNSRAINRILPPKLIIAGSGMSTGGRILFHEKFYLPDPRNCLLIITFQAKNTLGRQILDGAKKVKIFNEEIPVRAKVVSIEGYSYHADQEDLYNWLANFSKPVKHVFTVHGEKEASKALVQRVKDHLGMSASVPKLNEVVEL
jgi:metallo-beta-lactamase family protein